MALKGNYRTILIAITGIILAVATYLVVYHPELRWHVILVVFGLFAGTITSYYYYQQFEMEGMKLELPSNESVILESSGSGIMLQVTKYAGSQIGVSNPINVILYLTDKNIIAEPTDVEAFLEEGEPFVFIISLDDILSFSHEKRVLSNYLRVAFIDGLGDEQNVLLFTGADTDKWIENLSDIIA